MTKVLLAEDDEAIAGMYKLKLEDEGFTVLHAADGEEAVTIAKKEKPDLILLDVIMPKKEGTAVIVDLKADPELKGIPVVFLTNLGGRIEDTKAAQALGAEDLIVKSLVTPREVIEKVKEILARLKK